MDVIIALAVTITLAQVIDGRIALMLGGFSFVALRFWRRKLWAVITRWASTTELQDSINSEAQVASLASFTVLTEARERLSAFRRPSWVSDVDVFVPAFVYGLLGLWLFAVLSGGVAMIQTLFLPPYRDAFATGVKTWVCIYIILTIIEAALKVLTKKSPV